MSFISRLGKIVGGFGDAAANAADFVWDEMRAEWGDSDDEGLDAFFDHLGNVANAWNVFGDKDAYRAKLKELGADGPDGSITSGLEALAGAIPKPIRRGVVTPIKATLDVADSAYENVVDRPLSFLMTVGSLYDSPEFMRSLEGKSFAERVDAVRSEAWRVSETRSFGTSFGLALGTKDITSQEEVDEAYGSDWFRTVETVANIAPSFAADPLGIGLQSAKLLRAGRAAGTTKLFKNGYDVAEADRLYQFTSKAKSAGQVRDRLFPSRNALEGPAYAAALHNAAKEGPDAFNLTLRGLLGQGDAVAALEERHAQLAYQLGYLTRSRNAVQYKWYGRAIGETREAAVGVASDFDKHWFDLLDGAVAETNSQAARLERTLRVAGTLDTLPKVTKTGAVRQLATRSEFYQQSALAAPLRTLFGMNPQQVISVHADDADVHIDRFMAKAGVPQATRDAVRGQGVNAYSGGQVAATVDAAEDAVIDHVAGKYGLSADSLRSARDAGRAEMEQVLTGARYDANTRNTVVKFVDDEGVLVERYLPLAPEQFKNYKFLPDVAEIEKAAKRLAGLRGKENPPMEVADWYLEKFHRIWKPAVLLSARWPMRVVGEENVRAMSKIGAMALARQHVATAKGFVSDRLGVTPDDVADVPYVARRPVVIDGDTFAPSLMERSGPAVEARLLKESASFNRMYGQEEVGLRNQLYKSTQEWTQLKPGDNRYGEAWEHAVNKQLGRSKLARRLMENDLDLDDAVRWLTNDPDGVRFAQTMPIRSRNPEGWVNAVADQIIRYLPEKELQEAALRGDFSADAARALLPDEAMQPFIHGQNLDEVLGGGKFDGVEFFRTQVDNLMGKLMTTPTMRLSRQPVYDELYRRRLRTLVERAADDGLELTDMRRGNLERSARRYALGETRELLFDMAENSQIADAFRFVAPFADASREVVTRWAGITMDNPLFVRRMQVMWQTPEKAGFVYDGLGRQVGADGKVADLEGRRVDPEGGRFVRFIAPEWATDIPGIGKVLRGGIQFNKESMNTILANPFGAGPLVQVAVDKLVDPTPEQEESWKWLFPFGIGDGVWNTLAPTTLKQAAKGDNDRSRMALTMHIWNDLATQYELNGRDGAKPTIAEAKAIERRIHQMILVPSKFLSPVGIQTISPFQPYIDYLRQLQTADPATAGQRFYDEFGIEFAALANSITQSNDKIAPTVAAYRERAKYAELIEQYPELGAVIVGDVAGRFSQAVYEEQLRKAIGPNTSERQRELVPVEEFVKRPYISAGWNEFTKAMDAIDAARVARRLPNLRVKGARDLADAKSQIVQYLAAKYPDWHEQYMDSGNEAKRRARINGLRAIVDDPKLSQRDDIRTLGVYLQARDLLQEQLRRRATGGGSGVLNAVSNRDLALTWGTITSLLVESDLVFSNLYYRYLDHDEPSGARNAA